jgi:hypothetical protein
MKKICYIAFGLPQTGLHPTEGWGVFYNTGNKRNEVQRIDEQNKLSSDDEAKALAMKAGFEFNDYDFPYAITNGGQYLIVFEERDADTPITQWGKISEEDFDDRDAAMKRFWQAVTASQNSANSVSYHLIDLLRQALQMDDEELASFTMVVD